MATGLKIFNDSGTIQIDETYSNLVLIEKKTVTIALPVTTAYDYIASGDVVAIAVKCYPETFTTTAVSFSSGVWVYRLSFYNNPLTTGTCTFTIYAFGKVPTPSEDFGLAVYNASGGLVYHSQMKPLRILAVLGGASFYSAPVGRTVAAMFLSLSMYSAAGPPVTFETWSLRAPGNYIEPILLTLGAGGLGLVRNGQYAAVDVTHY